MNATETTFRVINDCGYGRVWSRAGYAPHAKAEAAMREWQCEGLDPRSLAAGFRRGGEWIIREEHQP